MVLSSGGRGIISAVAAFVIGGGLGCGPSGGDADDRPEPVRLEPAEVSVFSLQVSDLKRDTFGNGKKPATGESVAFWLANTGTVVAGRFESDDPVSRFDEEASRLITFSDDRGTDLTLPPDGEEINTFFDNNKPIAVRLGPGDGEGEFVIRGYRVPAADATALKGVADLAFMRLSGRKTAEQAEVPLEADTAIEVGPLRLRFVDPERAWSSPRRSGTLTLGPDNPVVGDANRPATPTAETHVAFEAEPTRTAIESVEWLGGDGNVLETFKGENFDMDRMTFFSERPAAERVTVRVTYYESAEPVILPLRFETGLGLRPSAETDSAAQALRRSP